MDNYFHHLESIPNHLLSTPYRGLYLVKWRAGQLLKKRSAAAINAAAAWLDVNMAEFKEATTAEETEKYIHDRASFLSTEGGWELAYLPMDHDEYWYGVRRSVSYDEIRHLLENWPSYADVQPDLPSSEDIDDLYALGEILCNGYPYDSIDGCEGASETELYAVLALMQLDYAASDIRASRGEHEIVGAVSENEQSRRLIRAANHIIEATETICYAERNLSEEQSRLRRESLQDEVVKAARVAVARAGGRARHGASNEAREWVRVQWQEHRQAYENNKSEFARHYMALVRERFVTRKGAPLRITDKTIREVWLSDSPAAGKTAGQQAAGE